MKFPRGYREAVAVAAASRAAKLTHHDGAQIRVVQAGRDDRAPISVLWDDVQAVTFYSDGRVKLNTGCRPGGEILRLINRCLPRGYCLRRPNWVVDGAAEMTAHVYLLGPGRDFDNPIACFLASSVFTPGEATDTTDAAHTAGEAVASCA